MAERIVLRDYWRSSSAYRVRIALNLVGLDHERVPVDLLAGEQRDTEHLQANPQGLVPALEIDGSRLTQSLEAVERRGVPEWLELDKGTQTAKVRSMPVREAITLPIREQLIVEFYSR